MNKIDFSKPVRTKGGEEVRILCTDRDAVSPIVGLIKPNTRYNGERIAAWRKDGVLFMEEHTREHDLENVPDDEANA